jgi:hypothetical protein
MTERRKKQPSGPIKKLQPARTKHVSEAKKVPHEIPTEVEPKLLAEGLDTKVALQSRPTHSALIKHRPSFLLQSSVCL